MTIGVTVLLLCFFNGFYATVRSLKQNGIKTSVSTRKGEQKVLTRRQRIAAAWAAHVGISVFVIAVAIAMKTNIWQLEMLAIPAFMGAAAGTNYLALHLMKEQDASNISPGEGETT